SKKSTILIILTTFIVAVLIGIAGVFFVFQEGLISEPADKQMVLIEKNYFNTKIESNEQSHVLSTGCKIYYKAKYSSKVNKALEKYGEDVNAMIGEYFRSKDIKDISEKDFFEETEIYIKDEINQILNEKISSKESLPVEYITEVVLFDTVYQ
ncbi:MAG: hypothetical protein IJ086_11320, partial [Clostridium sp.]|nr:hypothetical protein [Clostridium sp.]